jgi:hypothetical protein
MTQVGAVRMGEARILYAIAEDCPFDALLVRDMKRAINALLQLNLKRFRVPQKTVTKYSALDVMKQALELLYEFSPSERSYREAMRTIQVYSEGDEDMLRILRTSFSLIAKAVYTAFSGQRHVWSLAPDTLFLQGIPFDTTELQQSFRFVGVKPPDIGPSSVRQIVFLDEGFEPYRLLMDGELAPEEAQHGREDHWAKTIEGTLSKIDGTALIVAGTDHIDRDNRIFRRLASSIHEGETGKLPGMLLKNGIQIKVVHRIADVNRVFGK